MNRFVCLSVFCLIFSPAFAAAEDPKLEDLLGKWELTEEAAKIPKGSTFDFQKDGKLVLGVETNGERKMFEIKYELKEKLLAFTINGKTETTEITTLTKTELICKDRDGTTAKFKRVK
jgi:uncharacterized protein (TIGR03066 family)